MPPCTAGPCCDLVKAAEDLLEQAAIDDNEARLAIEELRQLRASMETSSTTLLDAIEQVLLVASVMIKTMREDVTGLLQLVSNVVAQAQAERERERLSREQADRLHLLTGKLQNAVARAALSRKRCLPALDALWKCSDGYRPRALDLSLRLTARHYKDLYIRGPQEFVGFHDGTIDMTWSAAVTLEQEGPSNLEMPGGEPLMDLTTGQPANAPREPAGPASSYAHFTEYINNPKLEYWFTGKADVTFKVDKYTCKAREPDQVEVEDFRHELAGSDLKMEAAILWSRFDPGKIHVRLSTSGDRTVVLNFKDVIIRGGEPRARNPVRVSASPAVWLDATIKTVSGHEADVSPWPPLDLGGNVSYAATRCEIELSVSDTSDWKQPLGKRLAHLLHLDDVTTMGDLVVQHS